MNYLRKNLSKILLISFILFAGIYIYLGHKDRVTNLNDGKIKFTIGVIVDFNWGAKSSPWFTYEFYIDDKKHVGRYDIVNELATVINNEEAKSKYFGKKYLVKYSTHKPKYNEMYLNKPIPDSLHQCVKCSWDTKPF